jgi:dethiobiotin synthetase
MHGLFITGTDTGVGKTYLTCQIVAACGEAGVRVGAYKPACSGSEVDANGQRYWPDVAALAAALPTKVPWDQICPQCFQVPLAPPSAAAAEERSVDAALLEQGVDRWRNEVDLLVVEGVGGLLCPLTETETVADLAGRLGFPLVIVSALRLGVINHTLLTIEAARQRRLPIAGVFLNETGPDDGSNSSSIAEITARGTVPVLGIIPFEKEHLLRPCEAIRKIHWTEVAATGAGG